MKEISIDEIERNRELAQEAVMHVIKQYEELSGMEVTDVNFIELDDGGYGISFDDCLKSGSYIRFEK